MTLPIAFIATWRDSSKHDAERGAGVVEYLGIAALSVALLAAIFAGLEAIGLDLLAQIRTTLGL